MAKSKTRAADDNRVVIKRYGNRRLYDHRDSRGVTIDDIGSHRLPNDQNP